MSSKPKTGIAVGLRKLYDRIASLPVPWRIIDAHEHLRESENSSADAQAENQPTAENISNKKPPRP